MFIVALPVVEVVDEVLFELGGGHVGEVDVEQECSAAVSVLGGVLVVCSGCG